jgi:hypothetical protein
MAEFVLLLLLLLLCHIAAGCTILTEAKSYAYARCGPTGAFATSGSATTQVSHQSTSHNTAHLLLVKKMRGCAAKVTHGSPC